MLVLCDGEHGDLITQRAFNALSELGLTTLFRSHPVTYEPRRIVAHVLPVAASEFGDPVPRLVLVKPSDGRLHARGLGRSSWDD